MILRYVNIFRDELIEIDWTCSCAMSVWNGELVRGRWRVFCCCWSKVVSLRRFGRRPSRDAIINNTTSQSSTMLHYLYSETILFWWKTAVPGSWCYGCKHAIVNVTAVRTGKVVWLWPLTPLILNIYLLFNNIIH